MKRLNWFSQMILTLVWVSAAAAAPSQAPQLDWSKLAGKPVSSIFFTRISGYEDADPARAGGAPNVILRTGNKAYLLTFYSPCWDLDFAFKIGVTSSGNRIHAGFDRILIEHPRSNPGCRIKTIQAVDSKALRAAKREIREAKKKLN
jgi:Family of unknown function (DUF6491)